MHANKELLRTTCTQECKCVCSSQTMTKYRRVAEWAWQEEKEWEIQLQGRYYSRKE